MSFFNKLGPIGIAASNVTLATHNRMQMAWCCQFCKVKTVQRALILTSMLEWHPDPSWHIGISVSLRVHHFIACVCAQRQSRRNVLSLFGPEQVFHCCRIFCRVSSNALMPSVHTKHKRKRHTPSVILPSVTLKVFNWCWQMKMKLVLCAVLVVLAASSVQGVSSFQPRHTDPGLQGLICFLYWLIFFSVADFFKQWAVLFRILHVFFFFVETKKLFFGFAGIVQCLRRTASTWKMQCQAKLVK